MNKSQKDVLQKKKHMSYFDPSEQKERVPEGVKGRRGVSAQLVESLCGTVGYKLLSDVSQTCTTSFPG